MAKQQGPYQFTGTMGDVTGYKRNGKHYVKGKNHVTRDRVLKSPNYARTRENSWEFRHASRSSMLIRRVLWPLAKLMKLADGHLSPRVNGLCTSIIRTDAVNGRGERRMHAGELDMLTDFIFRKEMNYGSVCRVLTSSTIDTETGAMQCTINPFDPSTRFEAPEGATHFQFVANGGSINFDTEEFHFDYTASRHYELDEYMEEAIKLQQTITTKPGMVLLHAVGIVFYKQDAKGQFQRVNGGVMRVMQVCVTEPAATATAPPETTTSGIQPVVALPALEPITAGEAANIPEPAAEGAAVCIKTHPVSEGEAACDAAVNEVLALVSGGKRSVPPTTSTHEMPGFVLKEPNDRQIASFMQQSADGIYLSGQSCLPALVKTE